MVKEYLKKVFSVFVLLLSLGLVFFINYYIILDVKYKAMDADIDVQAVQRDAEQLDRLYERLDRLEVVMRRKDAPLESTPEFREYTEIKRVIDGLRNSIDKSLNIEGETLFSKALSLLNFKNGGLLLLQIVLIVWIVFVFKGILKTVKSNKRFDNVSKAVFGFDKRDEIESYRAAYEAIKERENKAATNLQQEQEVYVRETVRGDEGYKRDIEIEQEDFRETVQQRSAWDKSNSHEYEMEERNEQVLRDRLNSKKWEQKLKKVMDNPRVKLIVDYHMQNMDVRDIAETTGLSRDEVEFVVKMWETVIKR